MKLKQTLTLVAILAVLLLLSCEDYSWTNPNDPLGVLDSAQWSPQDLVVEPLSDAQVRLSWTQQAQPVEGFLVFRKAGYDPWIQIAEVDPNQSEYIDTALTVAVPYTYRICAYGSGTDPQSKLEKSDEITTSFPSPDSPTATVESDVHIRLEWVDTCSYEEGFLVQRKEGYWGEWQTIETLIPDVTWYVDMDLSVGYYIYRIIAFTSWNQSQNPEDIPIHIIERDSVTDIDGNVYKTVRIGDQWWMAENLEVTHYRNGDPIPLFSDSVIWEHTWSGGRCYPEGTPEYHETYAFLYNWYAVNDSRGIAPEGWRVASWDDWCELETYLGLLNCDEWLERGEGLNLGGILKERDVEHWRFGNNGATDAVEFKALPAHSRSTDGRFNYVGFAATFWTSTEYSFSDAYYRSISADRTWINNHYRSKRWGSSVRCLKDD